MAAGVLGFAGPSGSGKTTLMERVITVLRDRGLRIAALKHGHHTADPDVPGKDTHRFRSAGARTVVYSGPDRWFLIEDLGPGEAPPSEWHLELLSRNHDLVLVEGWRAGPHPRIAVHRRAFGPFDWWQGYDALVAVATDDDEAAGAAGVPILPLDDPAKVADFIVAHLELPVG